MSRLLILLFLLGSGRLVAQTDSAAIIKSWIDYMTPGEMHAILAKMDGTWNAEISMWANPGDAVTTATGTTVYKMIMDGRYQEATNIATLMDMPFEGRGITAFDNAKKKFVTTWIDNMGTGILIMEGTWDPATQTISLKGKYTDPITLKEARMRETIKIIDQNTFLMEIYGPDLKTGKEYKTMEVKYTRSN